MKKLLLIVFLTFTTPSYAALIGTIDLTGGGGGGSNANLLGNLDAVSLGISYGEVCVTYSEVPPCSSGGGAIDPTLPYSDFYNGDALLGFNISWKNGETGEVIYDRSNSGVAFDNYASYLTNGVDELAYGWDLGVTPEGFWTTPSSGGANYESYEFGLLPDFKGYQIDYIKLLVTRVEISNDIECCQGWWSQNVSYDALWEIYGRAEPTQAPAPATIALFSIGLIGFGWSMRRKG